jgi:pantoate--beta-alanine ligase
MVRDLNLDVEIVTCPIIREQDGLALSSRNVYLQPEERRSALMLYRSLQAGKAEILSGERNPAVILAKVRSTIATEPGVDLDYAEIVDAETLEPLMTLARPGYLLIAARVGATRLIDNARIERNGDGPDGDGGFSVTI